jgi:hypothetical protein
MKKFLAFLLSMLLVFTFCVPVAFAANLPDEQAEDEIEEIPLPLIWSGDIYLSTSGYSTIISNNNWLNEDLMIMNSNLSAGTVYIRVTSTAGFTKTIQVSAGSTGHIYDIPWNSGTYTITAKAADTTGWYHLTIND